MKVKDALQEIQSKCGAERGGMPYLPGLLRDSEPPGRERDVEGNYVAHENGACSVGKPLQSYSLLGRGEYGYRCGAACPLIVLLRRVGYSSRSSSSRLMHMPTIRTIAFNKPYGVLPCFTDSNGRPTLADYINLPGVYAAGRLDLDSEGLLLLTSDGMLAHHVADPQHKLPKLYLAQVERIPNEDGLEQLRKGVLLNGKKTRPAEIRLLADDPQLPDRPVPIRFRKNVPTAWVEITLREGLNRQVRRMTAAVGHPTLRLMRVAIGPILLGALSSGQWRDLTSREIEQIYSVAAHK